MLLYSTVNELERKIPNPLMQAMLQIHVYLRFPFSYALNPCTQFFFFGFEACPYIARLFLVVGALVTLLCSSMLSSLIQTPKEPFSYQ